MAVDFRQNRERLQEDDLPARRRAMFRRKKVCRFCSDKELKFDYKDTRLLAQFITDRGKIIPSRITGSCARHQRRVAAAIKRARIVALLPFASAKF
ncbi:MAG: 30S ribosomal protein S18 [Candidatus Binatia bacterium]